MGETTLLEEADQGPKVVLVRTQFQGNIGSTARAMANNGLSRLVLVDPMPLVGSEARALAVGAAHLLDRAQTVKSLPEAIADSRIVVGTTSSRERVLGVLPEPPRAVVPALAELEPQELCFVFGPERSGLTNDELALCHHLLCIPASPKQPTLNLSQAVLIVAHEYFLSRPSGHPSAEVKPVRRRDRPIEAAPMREIDGLFEHFDLLTRGVGFARDDTFDAVVADFRRLAARAQLTTREVHLLRGVLRRTLHCIDREAGENAKLRGS